MQSFYKKADRESVVEWDVRGNTGGFYKKEGEF